MLALAAIALLAASVSAQSFSPNCFFNVSLGDNSPLIIYQPPSAFTSVFVNSVRWQAGLMGMGASVHSTFGQGPVVFIEYPGTQAWASGLVGNGSATPIRMTIDGVLQPYPEILDQAGFVFTGNDMPPGLHSVNITMDPTSTDPRAVMMFELFQSVVGISAETDNSAQVVCHNIEFAKHIGNTQVILKGSDWTPSQQFGGVGGQPLIDYTSITANNTPSVLLYPPVGSNYFFLNGTVGNAYGMYTVDISPPPPYPRKVNTFNASNSWEVPGETLYYTPLDPNVQYEVTVTGDPDITKFLGLNSWKYCDYQLNANNGKDNGTTPINGGNDSSPSVTPVPVPKPTNVGAIVGGVVGGVVGAAAIAALVFFLCRRNRKKDQPDADPAMFTIDDTVDATTPYQPSDSGAAKLSPNEQPYGGYPHYGQVLYQEPNMVETGYGASSGAAPLLSPYSTDGQQSRHTSMQYGGSSGQGSWPQPGSDGSFPEGNDGRQSFSATSAAGATAGMSMSGIPSDPGSAYGSSNGKTVPAHQRSFRVEHEQDAGSLPMPVPEEVERLPPTYNPHWLDTHTSSSGPSSGASGAGVSRESDAVVERDEVTKAGVFHAPVEKP
ncbi:hypothetical protein CspeluHIS016_0207240 [Cutaneotrichosporon spelunceum]|uniref:Uncharacterized protein n=1 Tax=Cutaneotrichosporon spelunceum TaxID=1672016 RepID=A0AAD3TS57_9TREE|nr:hypothetical protein CspeluHIS016_0207240 [Cutaneotrichosporon spelunceum]